MDNAREDAWWLENDRFKANIMVATTESCGQQQASSLMRMCRYDAEARPRCSIMYNGVMNARNADHLM